MGKNVYYFGEGSIEQKDLLGGKGAGLSEMTKIGVPVPPGFTISTEVCQLFYDNDHKIPDDVKEEVEKNLAKLEEDMSKKFGDKEDPLLVSVRSGAAISMPGMMDTILNLGLNDESVEGLAKKTGNERFAYDSYRRFIQMFGDVVLEVEHGKFEQILEEVKKKNNVNYDTELTSEMLKEVVEKYKELIKNEKGMDFPQDAKEQLWMAINAVFSSWNNPRAIKYRELNDIKGLKGTAVNVQAMVYGNMGDTSATGVCFTRNPSTGENKFYGEFLVNAQGEDVVAGIRTPRKIEEMEEVMPDVYKQLLEIREKLESHFKDMQDIEFTVQEGRLFILQTRNGKRTAKAAVKIAVDMVNEELIDKKTAIMRIDPNQIDQLLHPQIKDGTSYSAIAKGLPASPGAAVGKIVFDAKRAAELSNEGEKVILVRVETSPEDIEGMATAQGILTARGGMTSHAAVVARGMGKCCVAGCGELKIDEKNNIMEVNGKTYEEGDWISLNGTTGEVIEGRVELAVPKLEGEFKELMSWADSIRKLGVRTNADTPKDSRQALEFGAEGIGLCRTEHMFFDKERIMAVREMILSNTLEKRKKALDKLFPFQLKDFEEIFEVMDGLPVVIRLLDPPLHEFLPNTDEEFEILSKESGVKVEELKKIKESLSEVNPMLGHRGCRLAITYPEIYIMQSRAIITACLNLKKKGLNPKPRIMIPLIGSVKELSIIKKKIVEEISKLFDEMDETIEYKIGTMIEVPRAALTADEVSSEAEFFSFGTNDLTQMTLGFSRDDVGKFVGEYIKNGIYEYDPFQVIDENGVGKLVKMAVELGRKTNPNLSLGICGEHGGEPKSIDFAHRAGLDYVSCSPFRVPIARLAAAQAAIKNEK